jgi:hypothetical protein
MQWCVTIACAAITNNRQAAGKLHGPRATRLRWCVFSLISGLLGCASQELAPANIDPLWQLANAQSVDLKFFFSGRINYDRPLPSHMTQRLSDQFTLVTIRSTKDWEYVWRRLHLSGAIPQLDFTGGIVVGILADVGEFCQSSSPVQIHSIQVQGGMGMMDAELMTGVYHPLKTAGYVQLVYVPGVKTIRLVQINQASFILRSSAGNN